MKLLGGGVRFSGKQLIFEDQLLDKIFPIGAIYLSANNVSPASFLGGIWELLSGGYCLETWDYIITDESRGRDAEDDPENSRYYRMIPNALPNIKGSIDERAVYNAERFANDSGSLYHVAQGSSTKWSTGSSLSSTGRKLEKILFDASKSNNIYSDLCNHVQPNAYRVYAWRRIS